VTSVAAAGNSFGQYGGSFDIGRRFGAEREVGVRINASQAHTENGIRETGGQSKFASLGFDYKINDRLSIQGDYEYIARIAAGSGSRSGEQVARIRHRVIGITPFAAGSRLTPALLVAIRAMYS